MDHGAVLCVRQQTLLAYTHRAAKNALPLYQLVLLIKQKSVVTLAFTDRQLLLLANEYYSKSKESR